MIKHVKSHGQSCQGTRRHGPAHVRHVNGSRGGEWNFHEYLDHYQNPSLQKNVNKEINLIYLDPLPSPHNKEI